MVTIAKNESYNSYELTFDGKPSEEVREMMKANGYRWNGKRGIWYGYKDISALLNGEQTSEAESKPAESKEPSDDKKKQAELMEQYISDYCTQYSREDTKFLQYLRGSIARIVELDGGELLEIEKPRIETRFCFGYGYSGRSTEEEEENAANMARTADTDPRYFLEKNLAQLTDTVDRIRAYLDGEKADYCGTIPKAPFFCTKWGQVTKCLYFMRQWDYDTMSESEKAKYRKPSEEELNRILSAYEIEIKAFEKRLQAYLKRYGLSKLHTWTYLSD